jgi:hypothetical protein
MQHPSTLTVQQSSQDLKYFPENNAHPLKVDAYYLTELPAISRDQTETSHPPSITSDVKFLARGRGWVKNQELHTSILLSPSNKRERVKRAKKIGSA